MIYTSTKIEGVYLIQPKLISDDRGYFTRIFCKNELKDQNISYPIAQINRSFTKDIGMIRGMHYQKSPKGEDKIVQCLQGAIFDVALDLRKNSKTFGQWVGETLTAENMTMLLVPKGFAHGFQILEKNTTVQYFVSQFYAPKYENGIRWNDLFFNITWPINKNVI